MAQYLLWEGQNLLWEGQKLLWKVQFWLFPPLALPNVETTQKGKNLLWIGQYLLWEGSNLLWIGVVFTMEAPKITMKFVPFGWPLLLGRDPRSTKASQGYKFHSKFDASIVNTDPVHSKFWPSHSKYWPIHSKFLPFWVVLELGKPSGETIQKWTFHSNFWPFHSKFWPSHSKYWVSSE